MCYSDPSAPTLHRWHGWYLRQRLGEVCLWCGCSTVVDVPDIGAACVTCDWSEGAIRLQQGEAACV